MLYEKYLFPYPEWEGKAGKLFQRRIL